MNFQISVFVAVLLLAANVGLAQQADTATQDLQLNLEQFPDTQTAPAKEGLELNLEQFDKTGNPGNSDAGENLELNLEQFDKSSQSTTNIGSGSAKATRIEKTDPPQYNYKRIFLIGGLAFLFFLFILSRRRKSRG